MRVLFLVHEQNQDYTEEPAYVEIVKPFVASKIADEHETFVYQRYLRENILAYLNRRMACLSDRLKDRPIVVYGAGEFTKRYFPRLHEQFQIAAISDSNPDLWGEQLNRIPIVSPSEIDLYAHHVIISAHASQDEIERQLIALGVVSTHIFKLYESDQYQEEIHRTVEERLSRKIDRFKPDLIVLALTYAGENMRGSFFKAIKQRHPRLKMYTQWWDHADHIAELVQLEKDCLEFSNAVGIIDSYTRFQKIREQNGPYASYPNVNRLIWHPTVFDPFTYGRLPIKKKYDVTLLGSGDGERRKYIEWLGEQFPSQFHHFGGIRKPDRFMDRKTYVRLLNESRITINTQTHTHRIQFKGRVREALCCGTFLLEEDNPETRAFVDDGCGLVYFSDMQDLANKIDYYLMNPQERETIARRGHDWYHKNHNATKWVEAIMERI